MRAFPWPSLLRVGRGGLRLGLFFIVELCLVLFGESDFNCVTGRHSHGPLFLKWGRGGLRMGLFFIVELHLVPSESLTFNCVTGRHFYGSVLGVG